MQIHKLCLSLYDVSLFNVSVSFSAVMDSLASSVPNHNLINDPSHVSKPPPPPPPISYSNSRRRFTLTGAASSQSLPVCVIHHRGILVQDIYLTAFQTALFIINYSNFVTRTVYYFCFCTATPSLTGCRFTARLTKCASALNVELRTIRTTTQ